MIDLYLASPSGPPTRLRKVCPTQTRRGAVQFEREVIETHLARALTQDPSLSTNPLSLTTPPTLTEYTPLYLRDLESRGRKPSTRTSVERLLRLWILPQLGARRIDAMRTADFSAVRLAMTTAGRNPKTINNALVVLGAMIRHWHAEHDRVPPAFRVGMVRVPKSEAPYYRDDEARALVTAAASLGPDTLVMVLLGLDAGLRMSEIRALQWPDLVLTGRPTVTVSRTREGDEEYPPKGWRSRVIPLSQRLVQALRLLPRHLHDPHVLLDRRRRPLTRNQVGRRFALVQRHAGIHHGSFHSTRHTFCTRLAARGIEVQTIQALAGHAYLVTTQRYLHASPGAADAAIAALEERAGEAQGDPSGTPAEPSQTRPTRRHRLGTAQAPDAETAP